MKTKFFIAVLIIALAFGPVVGQQIEIFRTVTINNGESVSLGEDFSRISDLFESVGDMYGLKKGLYGGAEKIRVQVGDGQRIKAIHFIYGDKKDFRASVKGYELSLGKPTGEQNKNFSNLKFRKIFWEDTGTRFEMIEREQNGKVSVSSILFDKSGL